MKSSDEFWNHKIIFKEVYERISRGIIWEISERNSFWINENIWKKSAEEFLKETLGEFSKGVHGKISKSKHGKIFHGH